MNELLASPAPDARTSPSPVDADIDPTEDVIARLVGWWRTRSAPDAHGWLRAELAELRRAPSVAAVSLCPAYQRFQRSVFANAPSSWSGRRLDRLAAAVGLVAALRTESSDTRASIAALAGGSTERDGTPPAVSPARMRRLIECRDVDELYAELRRVLPLLKHQADPGQLARDVLAWDERGGRADSVRKRWAYAYEWPARANG